MTRESLLIIISGRLFFVLKKKFQKIKLFLKKRPKWHISFPIWCGKGDKHFSCHSWKGGEIMKPSDFQKTVQCRFESCLKKVVRHVVKDYQQELKRRKEKEIPFCELPEIIIEELAVWDDYDTDCTIFNVCSFDIRIFNDELAEALKQLPEKKRNILLMFYFLEMSDMEIGKLLNIDRRTSFRNRTSSLEKMKQILKKEN